MPFRITNVNDARSRCVRWISNKRTVWEIVTAFKLLPFIFENVVEKSCKTDNESILGRRFVKKGRRASFNLQQRPRHRHR